MQQITPFLWFDKEAEKAARFYVSVFKNSKILKITHYGEAGPGPKGAVMTVEFQLNGQPFVAFERRAAVQVYRGHIVRGELPDAGRGGYVLDETVPRRNQGTLWMA